jgi:hypothetical protein
MGRRHSHDRWRPCLPHISTNPPSTASWYETAQVTFVTKPCWLYLYVLWNLRPTTRQFAYCRDQRRFPPNKDSVDCDGGAFHRIATVIDCRTKEVIGYAMDDHYQTPLIPPSVRSPRRVREVANRRVK